jgi:hypothetical protein
VASSVTGVVMRVNVANSWYVTAWNKENGYEHYVDNYSVQANCSSCKTCGKATLFACKHTATRDLIFTKLMLENCQAKIWGPYIVGDEDSGLRGYDTMDCTRIFTMFRWTLCTQRFLCSWWRKQQAPRKHLFFLLWHCNPRRVMASSFLRFLDHTQQRTTVGRTPLEEWSARRRDLYLTTLATDKYLMTEAASSSKASFFFAVALRPNAGHGLLILEVSRSHTTTHHSR